MIVMDTESGAETLQPMKFSCEKELEDVVCRYPQLLLRSGDARLHLIKNQLRTSAGIADVLMADADGLPVIVEVKLARNPGARREIIGQVIDYVATLTSRTVDELNEDLSGVLENAFRENCADEKEFKQVWRNFGANLRAGLARYILVLDDAPEDLERLVRFLALRSNLDIRLVVVSKYIAANQQVVFVPSNLINDIDTGVSCKADTASSGISEELASVVEAYGHLAFSNSFRLRGTAQRYRQIKPDGWPNALHYEFIQSASGVRVELHLENDGVAVFGEPIAAAFDNQPLPRSDIMMRWDKVWAGGRGRLVCDIPADAGSEKIAQTMVTFIQNTKNKVDSLLEPPEREAA